MSDLIYYLNVFSKTCVDASGPLKDLGVAGMELAKVFSQINSSSDQHVLSVRVSEDSVLPTTSNVDTKLR